jgi:hypothetical protein
VTYFDHVRCSACKAMIDPESLANKPGQGLSCPRCGAPLSLGDLFGLKDAFSEEDQEELSLDDALSKMKAPTASVRPPEPAAPRGAPPPKTAAARPAPTPAPRPAAPRPAGGAPKQLPGPAPKPGARPAPTPARPASPPAAPSTAPAEAGSALEAMRALRKKK